MASKSGARENEERCLVRLKGLCDYCHSRGSGYRGESSARRRRKEASPPTNDTTPPLAPLPLPLLPPPHPASTRHPTVCGNCKVAQYCSKKCQAADWKAHVSLRSKKRRSAKKYQPQHTQISVCVCVCVSLETELLPSPGSAQR